MEPIESFEDALSKADAYWLCKEYDTAIELATFVLENAHGYKAVSAHWHRLSNYFDKGDYEAALEEATYLIALGDDKALLTRADCKTRFGDLVGAVADFRSAFKPDRDKKEYDEYGSTFQAITGVPGSPWSLLSKSEDEIREIESGVAGWMCYEGWRLEVSGRTEDALEHYSEKIKQDPSHAHFYEHRARASRNDRRLKDAVSDWSRVIELKPDLAISYERRGSVHFILRNFSAAIHDFDQALRISPSRMVRSRILRALCYRWTGRMEEAESSLREELASRSLTCWSDILAKFVMGRWGEPETLRAAAQHDPETAREFSAHVYFLSGSLRLMSGDSTRAREYFQRCVETAPWHLPERSLAQVELKALGLDSNESRTKSS